MDRKITSRGRHLQDPEGAVVGAPYAEDGHGHRQDVHKAADTDPSVVAKYSQEGDAAVAEDGHGVRTESHPLQVEERHVQLPGCADGGTQHGQGQMLESEKTLG